MSTPPNAEVKPAPEQGRLLPIVGVVFGLAVTIGGTIAMGILRVPREVATHLPNYWPYLAVWIAGGLYALAAAVSVAELAAMDPRSGGPFLLIKRALGRRPAFLAGWGDWCNWFLTCAAMSLVLGEYLPRLVPALAGYDKQVALAVLFGVALMQWRGLRWGSVVQEWTSALKALGFLALVVCCFAADSRPATDVADARPFPSGLTLVTAVVFAMQGVLFTYSGWEIATYFGEELKGAGHTIPRSMIGGTLLVIAIYLLFNLALLSVLSIQELAGAKLSAGAAAQKVFGARGELVVSALAVVSLLAGLTAAVLVSPRILLALGREGFFVHHVTHVNRGSTPDVALLLSTLASALFVVFSKRVEQLLEVIAFIVVTNYGMLFLSVFVRRWREPDAERPYRAWGYPWVPAFGLVGSLVFLVGAVMVWWQSLTTPSP